MTESIHELNERIQNLIDSLDSVDMEEEDLARQFIETKFLTVSLHAQTEQEKLKHLIKTASEQSTLKKQFRLYQEIKSILSGKCNDLSLAEMVEKLKECGEFISKNV